MAPTAGLTQDVCGAMVSCPMCAGPVDLVEGQPRCPLSHAFDHDELPVRVREEATRLCWSAVRGLEHSQCSPLATGSTPPSASLQGIIGHCRGRGPARRPAEMEGPGRRSRGCRNGPGTPRTPPHVGALREGEGLTAHAGGREWVGDVATAAPRDHGGSGRMTHDQERLRLDRDPTAPAHARRRVREFCADMPVDLQATAQLLTSEVVTNAVRHGSGSIEMHMSIDARALRVGVADDSPRHPRLLRASPGSASGRGVCLIEALASSWGTTPHPGDGKTVWFSLRT